MDSQKSIQFHSVGFENHQIWLLQFLFASMKSVVLIVDVIEILDDDCESNGEISTRLEAGKDALKMGSPEIFSVHRCGADVLGPRARRGAQLGVGGKVEVFFALSHG